MRAVCTPGFILIFLLNINSFALADAPTRFTYQGQLKNAERPVNDTCDMRFRIRTNPVGTDTTDVISTIVFDGSDPNYPPVVVKDGLFQVELDFGVNGWTQSPLWLDVAVRCPTGSGVFVGLLPRQQITATPYAINTRGIHVDDVGRVGIGTTSPTETLHVDGNVRAGKATIGESDTNGTGMTIRRLEPQVFPNPPEPRNADICYDGTRLSLLTGTTSSAPSPTHGLVIDNLARVGIGTVSPDTKLTVAGMIHATSGGIMFPDGTTQTSAALGGGSLWQASGSDIYYNGGKCGIGTDTPKQALHNTGDYYGKGHLWLYAYQGDGQDGTAYVQARDDSGTSSIGLKFRTQSGGSFVEALSLSPTGGVGIGDTAPASGLWVKAYGIPGFGGQFVIDSTDTSGDVDSGASIHFTNLTSLPGTHLGALSCFKENGNPTNGAYYLSFATRPNNNPPTERIRITSTGKVGIGTTNPADRLEVSDGMLSIDSGPSGSLAGIRIREDGSLRWTLLYRTWEGDDLHFYNEQQHQSAITIAAATNEVGIGTTHPKYRMDVVSSGASPGFSDWTAHFKDTDGTGEVWLAGDDGFGRDYGIETRGNTAGAFFHDGDGMGEARVAYSDDRNHQYGIWAKGRGASAEGAGGYFEDEMGDETRLATGGWGVWGFGVAGGASMTDTGSGTYAYLGFGGSSIWGNGSKNFVQNHPYDKNRVITYAAPEGDEVATYTRGSARLVNGEARVTLGESFQWVTNPDIGLTAHLTPRGDCQGLYVESVSTTELVVRESGGGRSNTAFDYLVYGLRIGFEEAPVVATKTREAPIPSMARNRSLYRDNPELRHFNALERFKTMNQTTAPQSPVDLTATRALHDAITEFDPSNVTRQSLDVKPLARATNTAASDEPLVDTTAVVVTPPSPNVANDRPASTDNTSVSQQQDEIKQLRERLDRMAEMLAQLSNTVHSDDR